MSRKAAQNHIVGPGERAQTDVEAAFKGELARGDRALRAVPPVLSHVLANSGRSLVSDAVVARLRGMLNSLADQLLEAKLGASHEREIPTDARDELGERLSGDSVVLSYCFALAMEGQLAERLEQRAGIDPVLSPLLQELIAAPDPATAELAMATLAAQSRFVQSQRRMGLPLSELPAEMFHAVLKRWEAHDRNDPALAPAIKALRAGYDEGACRVALLARLVRGMKRGAIAALDVEHGGFALFTTALSSLSKQPRELAILACHEGQSARLALSLRAAGLAPDAIEHQFAQLQAATRSPGDIGAIKPARAAAMLKTIGAPQGAA